ncbi:PH domain-containing protein [Staphylococcus warneri]|uniref:PH domain-containing protein n=1 Tax=Staphylococcus warneri TaxID=1292 RepID=UPI00253FC00D|nr:PH domain-containing protein [Staphylococcus warneri]MDK4214430.1 PH domain-containing protein [Staphylococcus warneri]
MSNYNYMDVNAKKSMVLAHSILLIILFLILICILILNWKFLHLIDNWSIAIGGIILFIACSITMLFVIPTFRYKNFRYKIKNNEIHVRKGIIFINANIIPFFRIQNIDISEGFIMRKYQLATVTLSTAGGNSELLLINKEKAEEIKHLIKERRNSENLNQNDVKL